MREHVTEEGRLNIDLTYRLSEPQMPAAEAAYDRLWQFASVLTRANLPIESWHPVASNKKATLRNTAFDANGPTSAAIAVAKRSKLSSGPIARSISVWNGLYENGGAMLSDQHVIDHHLCVVKLEVDGIDAFRNFATVVELVSEAVHIWSASSVQVGPFKYFFEQKVFELRPGAGWMLYLPRVVAGRQVPEAGRLIPVMDGNQQTGTIIASVVEGPFSAANPDHVKVANAIEVRLAEQDLLPLFVEL
jgi:hypothetical protein